MTTHAECCNAVIKEYRFAQLAVYNFLQNKKFAAEAFFIPDADTKYFFVSDEERDNYSVLYNVEIKDRPICWWDDNNEDNLMCYKVLKSMYESKMADTVYNALLMNMNSVQTRALQMGIMA